MLLKERCRSQIAREEDLVIFGLWFCGAQSDFFLFALVGVRRDKKQTKTKLKTKKLNPKQENTQNPIRQPEVAGMQVSLGLAEKHGLLRHRMLSNHESLGR